MRLDCRFRGNVDSILGKPDIRLEGRKYLIFVHGCFWHGHRGCSRAGIPQTNKSFWKRKIEGNVRRDARIRRKLKADGWRLLVVWQCQTKSSAMLERRLVSFIER